MKNPIKEFWKENKKGFIISYLVVLFMSFIIEFVQSKGKVNFLEFLQWIPVWFAVFLTITAFFYIVLGWFENE